MDDNAIFLNQLANKRLAHAHPNQTDAKKAERKCL